MSTRQAREGTAPQGVDERIAYRLDVSNWGNDPTNVSVLVKDRTGADVTATVVTGSASVAGNVITLPVIQALTAGVLYRVEVLFTIAGNVLEAHFLVQGEV